MWSSRRPVWNPVNPLESKNCGRELVVVRLLLHRLVSVRRPDFERVRHVAQRDLVEEVHSVPTEATVASSKVVALGVRVLEAVVEGKLYQLPARRSNSGWDLVKLWL